jgi:hypothetical protein
MESSFTLATWFWLLLPFMTIVLSAISLVRRR